MSANSIRGETTATIGDVEVTFVSDMNRLAILSRATGRPTFQELYQRLAGAEIDTILQAVNTFAVRGKKQDGGELDQSKTLEAIWAHLDVTALIRLGAPMTELLSALIKPGSVDKTVNPLGNATSAQS
jgi:hypothetical protein